MAVKFSGPLFDNPEEAIRKGARSGLSRLGAQIEATVRRITPSRTGSASRAVDVVVWQGNKGVSVKSNLPRGTRKTWLETGRRRPYGKIGPAYGMWRKGRAKARQINKQALMGPDIARAL